ncbi:MAG: hypothetical protein IKI95_00815 [Clostridia bacterium]|nr:hypothetical protein [Clostridia bacterium]
MNLLSEIISKPVLNLYTGKIEGTIQNAVFDKTFKKVIHLKMFNDDEEEFLIDTQKIYSLGENSIVIKNSEALLLCLSNINNNENTPMNMNVYTTLGNTKGTIKDVELNQKLETQFLITDKNEKIKQQEIFNIGENIIINQNNKKIKLTNFKPKNKVNAHNQVITILPKQTESEIKKIETTPVNTQPINNTPPTAFVEKKENYKIYKQPTPQKLIGNSNFLIGRKAIKTIYGINNEIIIKKDNIINAKNLESAKKHSKLVELTVFSKIKA